MVDEKRFPLSKEELLEELKKLELKYEVDIEVKHCNMDDLISSQLAALGYGEAMAFFDDALKDRKSQLAYVLREPRNGTIISDTLVLPANEIQAVRVEFVQ